MFFIDFSFLSDGSPSFTVETRHLFFFIPHLHVSSAPDILEPAMNVILIGMKHCGKTSAGTGLARLWAVPFFDLDDLVADRYEQAYGSRPSIEEIFKQEGVSLFHHFEAHAFRRFTEDIPQRNNRYVLALGGRTPLNPLLGDSLTRAGLVVYLNTSFPVIRERIMRRGTSGLLKGPDPEKELRETYEVRHPVYLSTAQLVVDGDGDLTEVITRLADRIKEYEHVG